MRNTTDTVTGERGCLRNSAVAEFDEGQAQGRTDWSRSAEEEERGLDKVCIFKVPD